MHIDFSAFLGSLVYMVEGMVGIFAVMGIIIGVIYGLDRLTAEKE